MFPISITIPNTFFITGLGRSGTAFLASVLNRSEKYKVVHEYWKEDWWRKNIRTFPVHRFMSNKTKVLDAFTRRKHIIGYGEVNSHLRHTIDPYKAGFEAMIGKRALIIRNPKDLISSAMNRHNRTIEDFEDVCNRVLKEYARIITFKNHPSLRYEVFDFEKATSDLKYLQGIVEWAGIPDLHVDEEIISKKINASKEFWFPKWEKWTEKQKNFFEMRYNKILGK